MISNDGRMSRTIKHGDDYKEDNNDNKSLTNHFLIKRKKNEEN